MEKTNFKKWGWWALGGVVAIVIIAALVAALGKSEPEGEKTPADNDGQTGVVVDDPADEEEPGDVAAGSGGTEALPQSGPVENSVLALLLAGVFAYIMSLALGNVFRAAKAEK